jgi:hypothetical protein
VNAPRFFAELKRRNVYKAAVAYAVVAWLLIQIATQVFPFFEIPNWDVRLIVLLLIIGFPVALIFSWTFEITPHGVKRTEDVAPEQSVTRKTGRKIVVWTLILGRRDGAVLSAFPFAKLVRGNEHVSTVRKIGLDFFYHYARARVIVVTKRGFFLPRTDGVPVPRMPPSEAAQRT